ncbi:MAG: cytochrome c553 [Oceanicoccus sp.]|jgi:cytochrome c553
MQDWHIEERLENFRSDKRGFDTLGPLTLVMKNHAKALNETQLSEIADHYFDKKGGIFKGVRRGGW